MAAAAAATFNLTRAEAKAGTDAVRWAIGCFNRPWVHAGWTYETALDGIKSAGYKSTGLLTPFNGEPFIGTSATPEYLDELKRKLPRAI